MTCQNCKCQECLVVHGLDFENEMSRLYQERIELGAAKPVTIIVNGEEFNLQWNQVTGASIVFLAFNDGCGTSVTYVSDDKQTFGLLGIDQMLEVTDGMRFNVVPYRSPKEDTRILDLDFPKFYKDGSFDYDLYRKWFNEGVQ